MPAERKERLGGGWTEGVEPGKEKDKHGKGREFMEGSVDCVCMLDDQHFVSGGDSGYVSVSDNLSCLTYLIDLSFFGTLERKSPSSFRLSLMDSHRSPQKTLFPLPAGSLPLQL